MKICECRFRQANTRQNQVGSLRFKERKCGNQILIYDNNKRMQPRHKCSLNFGKAQDKHIFGNTISKRCLESLEIEWLETVWFSKRAVTSMSSEYFFEPRLCFLQFFSNRWMIELFLNGLGFPWSRTSNGALIWRRCFGCCLLSKEGTRSQPTKTRLLS